MAKRILTEEQKAELKKKYPHLSPEEADKLDKLLKKEKAAEKHEAEFLKEADARKDELLKRWHINIKQSSDAPTQTTGTEFNRNRLS